VSGRESLVLDEEDIRWLALYGRALESLWVAFDSGRMQSFDTLGWRACLFSAASFRNQSFATPTTSSQ